MLQEAPTLLFTPAFCGLLPHPPIIVPAVGGRRLEDCQQTHDACVDLARRLVATAPDRLFLISPHAPRRRHAYGLWSGNRLVGDLGRFGAPEAGVDLPNDPPQATAVAREAEAAGIDTWEIPPEALDHGAAIPLWFLAQAGWRGPTAIASLPFSATTSTHAVFGRAVARALASLPGRAALIASGDMSHRVLPGAPAGFHRRAVEFDQQLTALVEEGRLEDIAALDPELRELAAEDAADTSIFAAAALDHRPSGAEVLSYEHPFGVGYLVAVFHDGATPARVSA